MYSGSGIATLGQRRITQDCYKSLNITSIWINGIADHSDARGDYLPRIQSLLYDCVRKMSPGAPLQPTGIEEHSE